jgi:ribonuclease-3
LTNSRKEPYLLFYRLTGFIPDNIGLYQLAMCHKSTGAKDAAGHAANNERLEFLGDAVLDAVVADILYQRFGDKEEGFLTDTRSKIVQRESLNKLAIEMELPALMQLSAKNGGLHGNNVFGNAFEALVGAIYLDQGYERCKQFIEKKLIASFININKLANKEVNFKSRLIEWGQSNKVPVEFEVIETFHDSHNELVFQTRALVNGLSGGIGIGHSKKESQQNAAKMTIRKMQEDTAFCEEAKHIVLPVPETEQQAGGEDTPAADEGELLHNGHEQPEAMSEKEQ